MYLQGVKTDLEEVTVGLLTWGKLLNPAIIHSPKP